MMELRQEQDLDVSAISTIIVVSFMLARFKSLNSENDIRLMLAPKSAAARILRLRIVQACRVKGSLPDWVP